MREERRSRSSCSESPVPKKGSSASKVRRPSRSPDSPRDGSLSPKRGRMETEEERYSESPKESSRSPVDKRYDESPYAANGRNRSSSPVEDRSPVEDDGNGAYPQGSESP